LIELGEFKPEMQVFYA
jgi:hypothetical protein